MKRAFTNVKILKFWRSVHTVQYRYVSGTWYLLCGHLGSCSSNNRGSSNSRLQSSPGHVDRHLILDHSEILSCNPNLAGLRCSCKSVLLCRKFSLPVMVKVCTTKLRFLLVEASQKHLITFQGTESGRIPRTKIITCSLFL